MTQRWIGVVVSGDAVRVVDAEIPADKKVRPTIIADHSWKLQTGERAAAYSVMHNTVSDYCREQKIDVAIVKASATSRNVTKAHLDSAELRGVVISAAAAHSRTRCLGKSNISNNFGDRNVDEYLKDDEFWEEKFSGKELRAGSREAAILILAAGKKK